MFIGHDARLRGKRRTQHTSQRAEVREIVHKKENKWMKMIIEEEARDEAGSVCAVDANTTGNSVRAVLKMHNFEGE